MENDGKAVLDGTRRIRILFEDIAKLLATCDAMMADRGWEPRLRNTAITGMSWSLQFPRQWMPHTVFRYLQHKDVPHKLVSVAVVLDDPEKQTRLREPLVSGMVYDYGKGQKIQDDWTQEYAGWHVWIDGATDDGVPITIDPRAAWPGDGIKAPQLTSFAVPLVSIANSQLLEEQVVVPLDRIARRDPGTERR